MPTRTDQIPEAEELVQVVVSNMPKSLLKKIDEAARLNNRTRAAEIRHTLAERMAERRTPAAA